MQPSLFDPVQPGDLITVGDRVCQVRKVQGDQVIAWPVPYSQHPDQMEAFEVKAVSPTGLWWPVPSFEDICGWFERHHGISRALQGWNRRADGTVVVYREVWEGAGSPGELVGGHDRVPACILVRFPTFPEEADLIQLITPLIGGVR